MSEAAPVHWQLAPDHVFALDRCRVIGILNITPDSFSDGGMYADIDRAIGRTVSMVHEGAAMIDIGGESTRPGAEPVEAAEQVRRVVPVIEAIRRRFETPISIDTTSAVVAEAALDAGATAINDVSAGEDDPGMFPLAAQRRCGLILMHRRCRPAEDSWSDEYERAPAYDDVVHAVRSRLLERADSAIAAGVDPASIVLDPGLGFGKNVGQNARLIAAAASFVDTGYPVLCAASRKSFIGAVTGQTNPGDRIAGSVAIALWQAARGVRLFRVHDVSAHVAALSAFDRGHGGVRALGAAWRTLLDSTVETG